MMNNPIAIKLIIKTDHPSCEIIAVRNVEVYKNNKAEMGIIMNATSRFIC